MPMSRAVRLCPALTIVPANFAKYRSVSQQVLAIHREVTSLVEPLSLDEAYLDVTENAWGEPLGVKVARRLKAAIHGTTGLTASAGVAPNKFLAKIASGWRKPDGLTVVAPGEDRVVPAEADRRGTLGRRPRDREAAARARHRAAAGRTDRRSRGPARHRRQHDGMAPAAGRRRGRPSGGAESTLQVVIL